LPAPLPRSHEPPAPNTSTAVLCITLCLPITVSAVALVVEGIAIPDHRFAQVSAADLAGRDDALIAVAVYLDGNVPLDVANLSWALLP
jgi:hypothetical protein